MKKAITILINGLQVGILLAIACSVIAGLIIAIHSHLNGLHF